MLKSIAKLLSLDCFNILCKRWHPKTCPTGAPAETGKKGEGAKLYDVHRLRSRTFSYDCGTWGSQEVLS